MKPREPSDPNLTAESSGPTLMRGLGGLVLGQLKQALVQHAALNKVARDSPSTLNEPPVVAQLMIEIRSDGSRTIARGALNDLRTGESAKVHAEGRTPAELIVSLASSLMALPSSVFKHVRGQPSVSEVLEQNVAASSAPSVTKKNER